MLGGFATACRIAWNGYLDTCSFRKPLPAYCHLARGGKLPQRVFQHLDRLPALNQVTVIDDDRRNRVDAVVEIELLACAHLGDVLVRSKDRLRTLRIEANVTRHANQQGVVAGVLASVK